MQSICTQIVVWQPHERERESPGTARFLERWLLQLMSVPTQVLESTKRTIQLLEGSFLRLFFSRRSEISLSLSRVKGAAKRAHASDGEKEERQRNPLLIGIKESKRSKVAPQLMQRPSPQL